MIRPNGMEGLLTNDQELRVEALGLLAVFGTIGVIAGIYKLIVLAAALF